MKIDRIALERELSFRTSRSGGPGGQSVNKTETKVEAIFSVKHSSLFTDQQKAQLLEKLSSRITTSGELIVAASDQRSQRANKQFAVDRILELLEKGLEVRKPRKSTKPSRAAIKKRLESKAKRAAVKKGRGWKPDS